MITAIIALVGIFHGAPTQGQLTDLDVTNDFDKRCRQELDLIDSQFIKWKFPSRLRWCEGGSRTSAADGIAIDRSQIEKLVSELPVEHSWIPITFALAHEKVHLIQAKIYADKLEQMPEPVMEAQADMMAAAYTLNRILKYEITFGPRGEMIWRSTAAEWRAARMQEMFSLIRLGFKLGDTSLQLGKHPEPWERGTAVEMGTAMGMASVKAFMPGGKGIETIREDMAMKPDEDFAAWSLRHSYGIIGLPEGTLDKERPGFKLANAEDPLGSILKVCAASVKDRFRSLRGPKISEDSDYAFYSSKLNLPEFNYHQIMIDPGKDHQDELFFRVDTAFPFDIYEGLYAGYRFRLERLLRDDWVAEGESDRKRAKSKSWSNEKLGAKITVCLYKGDKPMIDIEVEPVDSGSPRTLSRMSR